MPRIRDIVYENRSNAHRTDANDRIRRIRGSAGNNSRDAVHRNKREASGGTRGLARFLYCLRAIVPIIAGQRPRRRQCDTSRISFRIRATRPRPSLRSPRACLLLLAHPYLYLIRHPREMFCRWANSSFSLSARQAEFSRESVPLYCTASTRAFTARR